MSVPGGALHVVVVAAKKGKNSENRVHGRQADEVRPVMPVLEPQSTIPNPRSDPYKYYHSGYNLTLAANRRGVHS